MQTVAIEAGSLTAGGASLQLGCHSDTKSAIIQVTEGMEQARCLVSASQLEFVISKLLSTLGKLQDGAANPEKAINWNGGYDAVYGPNGTETKRMKIMRKQKEYMQTSKFRSAQFKVGDSVICGLCKSTRSTPLPILPCRLSDECLIYTIVEIEKSETCESGLMFRLYPPVEGTVNPDKASIDGGWLTRVILEDEVWREDPSFIIPFGPSVTNASKQSTLPESASTKPDADPFPTEVVHETEQDFATYVNTRYRNESKEWRTLIIAGWPDILVRAFLEDKPNTEYKVYTSNMVGVGDIIEIIGNWVCVRNTRPNVKSKSVAIRLRDITRVLELPITADDSSSRAD